jgi:hypothetical protein
MCGEIYPGDPEKEMRERPKEMKNKKLKGTRESKDR